VATARHCRHPRRPCCGATRTIFAREFGRDIEACPSCVPRGPEGKRLR
jgi:hypothetical protein